MKIIDSKTPIKAWVDHVEWDPEVEEQLKQLAQLPFIFKHIAVMPDADLAYLAQGTKEFDAYIKDLLWAQDYASVNRKTMMNLVLNTISQHIYHEKKDLLRESMVIVNCHHNYSRLETHFGKKIWVTRKGAVSAQKNELGIIPGSMGNKSYIVRGKGNVESFCSCSHGAGRRMSRAKAKKLFTLQDLQKQTIEVECRKDKYVIDEIPSAYKNIDEVMKSQADLVQIVYTLKQILCVKG